jgi:hypothetical protein
MNYEGGGASWGKKNVKVTGRVAKAAKHGAAALDYLRVSLWTLGSKIYYLNFYGC